MLFKKLLPREGNFFALFDQHADRIVEAARAFSKLVANYDDATLREQYNREVDHAERAADKVTQEVNRLIHQTFITPIDREQIHGLINAMDDVLDLLQDSTETMSLYDVREVTPEQWEDLKRRLYESHDRVMATINSFENVSSSNRSNIGFTRSSGICTDIQLSPLILVNFHQNRRNFFQL